MNCVSLSMIMELGTPNWWIISVNNSTAYSALILAMGRTSIHMENLSIMTSKWVKPPGAFCKGPTRSRPQTGSDDLSGVYHSGEPVETLSEGISY